MTIINKIDLSWNIFNLIFHSLFAMFMSFIAIVNIINGNILGLITAIMSVGLWLILIIFYDIKGIRRCLKNNDNNKNSN